ncbi:hypothetical protein SUDANB43_05869 [Streptomyces sp. enrichment culture]
MTGWLTRHPATLTEEENLHRKAVLDRCPELASAAELTSSFAEMLTTLGGDRLPEWITEASNANLPGISTFAIGLNSDLDAVTAGLTTDWNSGPVEGAVNRIKMLKRQMFDRAGFELLRKRVLLPPEDPRSAHVLNESKAVRKLVQKRPPRRIASHHMPLTSRSVTTARNLCQTPNQSVNAKGSTLTARGAMPERSR